MSSKHLYNSSEGLVLKSLQGAVALNPSLLLHQPSKTVYVSPPSSRTKVSIISGGGAGHEPAHASYTGHGMLAASVCGEVFASPSAKQIISTIRLASYPGDSDGVHDAHGANISIGSATPSHPFPRKDVLVIINNYTGDRLNFGLAIEKARAEGIRVESVVVADDVSLLNSPGSSANLVGPRGLAGNILVCKILGALAEREASLEDIKRVGDAVVTHLASIGVGLEHCHIPGSARVNSVSSQLGEDQCEVGLGLHNEPGAKRVNLSAWDSQSNNSGSDKLDSVAAKLVDEMVGRVLRSRGVVDGGRDVFISEADKVVLFVNNLGGMSQLEMGAILTDILARLALSDIHPSRTYCSSFMTSLNAPGFSLSLLNISAIDREVKLDSTLNILQLLDDPTDAHSWIGVRRFWPPNGQRKEVREDTETILRLMSATQPSLERTSNPVDLDGGLTTPTYWQQVDISPERVEQGIIGACRALLQEESVLTEYDTIVGDGDCGVTFARGAKAIISSIENRLIKVQELSLDEVVRRTGDVLEDNMGGTIGALFAIFFTAWASAIKLRLIVQSTSSLSNPSTLSIKAIMDSLSDALVSLSHHTPAKPGDRTLIDALYSFCNTGSSSSSNVDISLPLGRDNADIWNFAEACIRAREGALRTRGMKPRLGRAVYVEIKEGSDSELPPDPGAWGVALLVQGFRDGFYKQIS